MRLWFALYIVSLLFGVLRVAPVLGADLCVNAEFANLRSGPGTQYPQTWKVFRYMPLEKLSKKDGWYEVRDLDGKTHWIKEDLVSTSLHCAVISNDFAYLRQAPSQNAPKARAQRGSKYLSFRVVEVKEDWVKVEDSEGDQAWIHRPLLWMR